MSTRRQRTFLDVTGRWLRTCGACEQTKDLRREFYTAREQPTGRLSEDYDYWCKGCRKAYTSTAMKAERRDPIKGPVLRARDLVRIGGWREQNREQSRALQRAYYWRTKADPARHARYLETQRIAYHLRKERNGQPVRHHFSVVTMGSDIQPTVPAAPLADLVDRLVIARGGDITSVCADLGIATRNLTGWRTGERVNAQFDVADRVLTAAGALWWEVWSPDDYPEVHERLAA